MSDDEAPQRRVRRKIGGMSDTNVWALMEQIVDKLMILNYEKEFCVPRSFKPLARTHFALAGQPEAQFPYFAQLCAWLIRELTPDFIEWNEFEDPTTICENISAEIRRLGFPGDVQTSDMKRGSGDGVCLIIDFLATKLMQHQSFRVSQPRYAAFTGDAEEAVVDDDGGGEDGDIAEDVPDGGGDDDDNYFTGGGGGGGGGGGVSDDDDDDAQNNQNNENNSNNLMPVMEATVDPAEWRIELERVAPLLRFAANPHATKEWRAHLEQSVRHDKELKEGLPAVRTQLQKLGRHLRKSVERIEQKEEHINKEFDHLGADFRAQQQQLDAAQTRYNALSASVSELTSDLSSKADAVEMLKSQMTDRNDSMTDTSPLRRITAALSGLQAEVEAMELRIGVVGQTLLQSKVKSGKSTRVHGRHVGGMSIGAGDDGRERKGRRQR